MRLGKDKAENQHALSLLGVETERVAGNDFALNYL